MSSYFRTVRPAANLDDVPEATFAIASEEDAVCDRDMVDRLLGVLSPDERELVLLKYQLGMRNVDIAEHLGMNASTVSTKLANALRKMRVDAEGD